MNIIEKAYNWAYGASYRTRTDMIIIHHAAGRGSPDDIHRIHLGNGWRGIAYNFYIRENGDIYRGREENACGGHTGNYNSTSIGICFEGNYENQQLSAAALKAGQELLAYLLGKYGNLPIYKHSELNATACPGRNFPWNELVKANQVSPTPKPDTTLYRVRKSWQDVTSQLGAFLDYAKAKLLADENPGYSIFTPDGTAVYTKPDTRTPNQVTVDNAFADGVITDKAYWLGVLEGMYTANPGHLKTLMDRYHGKM